MLLGPYKLALKVVAGLVSALLVYVGVTFVQVWVTARRDEARPAEAILVFGAAQYDGRPSPVLAARLDHAAELWHEEIAPYVVVTGGKRPGDRFTEATAAATYLHGKGVPDEAILREVSGRNSWESLAAAAGFLRQRGIDQVVLVSDPFHSARIKAMAGELDLEGFTSPTRSSPIDGFEELKQMGKEAVAVSVGRVIGYRRLMRVDRAVVRVRHGTGSG